MTTFLFISLAILFLALVATSLYYWLVVVRPVNREIIDGVFINKAEIIHDKIMAARTHNDCRRIQTNLLAMQKKYAGKVRRGIIDPVMRKLWGELDCRTRLLIYQAENRLVNDEKGTMTVEQLIGRA